jgi:regulatory protein
MQLKNSVPPNEDDICAGNITQIEPQQKNRKRVSIFIDGRFAFGLAQDLAISNGLVCGLMLNCERQRELIAEDQLLRAKNIALEYISSRGRSSKEVFDKLIECEVSESTARSVIARFSDLGYIDDRRYAADYAQYRLKEKGHGPHRIMRDLRSRGIDDDIIAQTMSDLNEVNSAQDSALQLAQKRWQRLANETDPLKKKKKVFDFLLRRGFDYDTTRQTIDRLVSGEFLD